MSYYFNKKMEGDFNDITQMIKNSLKKEGFGVLTEIDLQAKFKDSLNVKIDKYLILGACNPMYAHKAISRDAKIGTLLPCNVIVQQVDEGIVEVTAIDPAASMTIVNDEEIALIAIEIGQKLKKALDIK